MARWEPVETELRNSVPALFASLRDCPDCEFEIRGCVSSKLIISASFWGMGNLPKTVPTGGIFRKVGETLQTYFYDQRIDVVDVDFRVRRLTAQPGEALH